jgi:hypothetical protein
VSYVVWDVETSIRASFKRKANPFDPENFVVMSGWQRKGGKVVGEYFGNGDRPFDWFSKLLDGTTLLIGQNIKFDLLYALREPHNREAWMRYVAAGGNVWDCQLAEYLLEGMDPAHHMLSMDELAPRYGGNTKFDEVKSLWQAGVSTEDINPDLLRRYLCGTQATDGTPLEHGDIGNTEAIFLGQLERARACGQVKSILLNMGALLCTTEMELNGMAVNVSRGLELAKDLEAELAELSLSLSGYIPADCPFDFNWGSGLQKSALIFGGKVKYQARTFLTDQHGKQLYAQKEERQPILDDAGEPVRFKSGKNAGEVKTRVVKLDDLDKPKSRMEDYWYAFPGYTKPKPKWAGATPGVYSTSAEVIAELGDRDIPFLQTLGKVTGLRKDLTTYYLVTDPDTGEQTGMLTLVQADGIIHHMLNHTSTVTARFSSSNPNLQNLPKGGKSDVKSIFHSRFGAEGKIIQSDFTALEVYIQAILTKCSQLIADLQAGLDMHCVRVGQKEGIPYEEAFRLCKTEAIPEWDAKRTKAKVFSFQRAYGAGAATISDKAKIPLEEVEALIEAENARYPEIEKFYTGPGGLTEQIKASSIPTGKFFQHSLIPGLSCNPRKGYYRTPDNKLYTFRESESPDFLAKRGQSTSFSPTEVKNYPVQGGGGEWAKAAMWLAVRAFYARRNFDGQALLVNQVHDALYADAHTDIALDAAALLHACMEEASTFMEWYFAWDIPVPVPSDTSWGANMLEEGKMPPEFPARVSRARAKVRADYIHSYEPSCERSQLKEAA